MSQLLVRGGQPLHGEVTIQGAKNSVLPILAATVLTGDRVVLRGCPRLRDVDASIRILQSLGCRAQWEGDALTVDTAAKTARRGERTLELSAREYALLEYLIRNKGVILSRAQIENSLWSFDYAGGTNVVDVYISYLRKKLERDGEAKLLHTVRGMGWVLKEDA